MIERWTIDRLDMPPLMQIQNREEVTLGDEQRKFVTIRTTNTNSTLDLTKPLENAYINNIKDMASVKISFLKSIYGNKYYCILGALGQPNNTTKILDEKGKNLGTFKILDSISTIFPDGLSLCLSRLWVNYTISKFDKHPNAIILAIF